MVKAIATVHLYWCNLAINRDQSSWTNTTVGYCGCVYNTGRNAWNGEGNRRPGTYSWAWSLMEEMWMKLNLYSARTGWISVGGAKKFWNTDTVVTTVVVACTFAELVPVVKQGGSSRCWRYNKLRAWTTPQRSWMEWILPGKVPGVAAVIVADPPPKLSCAWSHKWAITKS